MLQAGRLWRAAGGGVLLALAGCGAPATGNVQVGPTMVLVSRPIVDEVIDYQDFTGRTEAVKSVDLRARVSGYLTKINFQPGDEVQEGALLFEIDPRPYKATLDQALASLVGAEGRLKRAEADFARAAKLLPSKTITQEEYDQIAATLTESRALADGAKAQIEQAQLNLEFTTIKAPITGRIGRNLIDAGNLVAADVTLLANIVTVDPMYAFFDVDERTVLTIQKMIREGALPNYKEARFPVHVGLATEEGFPHEGTIDFVNNRVNENTGTLQVRAVLDNAAVGKNQRVFSPGLFVRLRLPIGKPHEALLVSERALGTDQGQRFVYVVDEAGEVVQRPVRVGQLQAGLRAITAGLQPDDRVIVSGLQRVRPGVKVEAKEAPIRPEQPQAAGPPQAETPGR